MERKPHQRGLNTIEVAIVLVEIALVFGLWVGPAMFHKIAEARRDVTRRQLRALTQRADACHEPLPLDAWGRPYLIRCVPPLPAGCAQPPCIHSVGRDGVDGTDDDLRGWEDSHRR